ncbi:hypothetical protein BBI11_13020 [Planococcus maritimus]|uniref:hypothetical protein n=1 Tax=Planococcus maritimus TaxID=192421 RepID=UPI00080F0DF9|nr:hypothetical protein [Planococcus maritimus]ANU17896.1 hypothetical protein BBI11_13020 [Planococcus maritimus]
MPVNDQATEVVNRNKSKMIQSDTVEPLLKSVGQQTVNDALATQFPEWDLKPPANLVRRKRTKL